MVATIGAVMGGRYKHGNHISHSNYINNSHNSIIIVAATMVIIVSTLTEVGVTIVAVGTLNHLNIIIVTTGGRNNQSNYSIWHQSHIVPG